MRVAFQLRSKPALNLLKGQACGFPLNARGNDMGGEILEGKRLRKNGDPRLAQKFIFHIPQSMLPVIPDSL